MIKKFENYKKTDLDPYDEEIWNDEISQDNDIKEGDAVICINNDNMNPLIMKPVVGEKYRVVEVLPNDMIKVRPLNDNKWKYTGKYKINRFKKTKDPFKNEHIHYLLDDYDDVPEENIEVVGLPSGEYSLLKRKDYEKYLTQYVNWSEKLKCYVYRDKDFNRIKIFLFSP